MPIKLRRWLWRWLPILFGCHCRPDRSFHFRDGTPFPICARCTGELAGILAGLEASKGDYVAMMDGDLVANLPLADIYESHLRSGADITVVCGDDSFATEDGTYFEKNEDGRVTEVLYNLHRHRG